MKLYVMCGLPGSGKSTYAKSIDAEVISSDEIRINKYDSVMDQSHNGEVFAEVYKKANELLKTTDVLIDATNTSKKMRAKLLNAIKTPCEKICVVIPTEVNECIRRRSAPDKDGKTVSKDVIMRYYRNFDIPCLEEGFDKIDIIGDCKFGLDDLMKITETMRDFDQNSPYHRYDLMSHCFLATSYLVQEPRYKQDSSLYWAMFLHDIGKLFTGITDEKGISHYPNHANVGAYELLSHGMTDLDLLFYVNNHTKAKDWTTEKLIKKYSEIYGEKKVRNLVMMSRCDEKAYGLND